MAVYERVSPSIAFIDVGSGTGSGVLTEGGYLVTNAHVVWPYEKVRVVFPNGVEIEDVPVIDFDLIADLAVIGPLDVDLPGLPLVDGERLSIGSPVYLIGYPGEVESIPQASLSQGLLSRRREWEQGGITYLQADAAIAGGQSGGALISENGDVVGISGFSFTEGVFALAASAADIEPRIQALIAGEDAGQLGERSLFGATPRENHTVLVESQRRLPSFVVDEPPGTHFEAQLSPLDDYAIEVYDVNGEQVATSYDSEIGINRASFDIDLAAPYFILIAPTSDNSAATAISLTGSKPFWKLNDRDDGQLIRNGETKRASIDIPGESDSYRIALQKGEEVTIKVDSILLDAVLSLYDRESSRPGDVIAVDDDSGGGLFGLNPAITYRSPKNGLFEIAVFAGPEDMGGYFITVDQPYEGAPTAVVPTPTITPIASEAGKMWLYRFEGRPHFSLQYPAGWQAEATTGAFRDACDSLTACFSPSDDPVVLMIEVEDLREVGWDGMSQEEYADIIIADLQASVVEFALIDREERTTAGGWQIEDIEYAFGENSILHAHRLIALANDVGFNATYILPSVPESFALGEAERIYLDGLDRIVDYSFDSFVID